jgi:hypothetical protein
MPVYPGVFGPRLAGKRRLEVQGLFQKPLIPTPSRIDIWDYSVSEQGMKPSLSCASQSKNFLTSDTLRLPK